MKKFLSVMLSFLMFMFFVGVTHAKSYPTSTTKVDPSPSASPAVVNSFELFWPISAGKVRGESLYALKLLKENVRGMLIFSDFKKSDYMKTLSEKRTVEAEKLLTQVKDYKNAAGTLNDAHSARQNAYDLFQKSLQAGDGEANNLKSSLRSSLEKQKSVLSYILTQIPEDQKSLVNENIKKLEEILAKLQ